MQPSKIGTEAAYFQYGLEAGLLPESEAKEWAFSVIETIDSPPYEVIAVAESNGLNALLSALSSVQGERNLKQAGEWLLGKIRTELEAGRLSPGAAAKNAMRVLKSAGLGEDVYYTFDLVDDELYLAETRQYGTVEECLADLKAALKPYAPYVPVRHNKRL